MRNHLINVSLWLWNALCVYRAMRRRLDRVVRRTGLGYADFKESKYQHSINCAAGRVRSLRKRLSSLISALPISDEKKEAPKVSLGPKLNLGELSENPAPGRPVTLETKSTSEQEAQSLELFGENVYTSCFVRNHVQTIENLNSHLQSKLDRLSIKLMKRNIELDKIKHNVQALEVEIEELRFGGSQTFDEVEHMRQKLSIENEVLKKRVSYLEIDNEYYHQRDLGSSETALAKRLGAMVLNRNLYTGISNSSIVQTLERWSIHRPPEIKDLLAIVDAAERNMMNGFWKMLSVFKEYKKEFKKYQQLPKETIVQDYRDLLGFLEAATEEFTSSFPSVLHIEEPKSPVLDGEEGPDGEAEDQEDYNVRFHTPLDGSRPEAPRFTSNGPRKPRVFSTMWEDGHE